MQQFLKVDKEQLRVVITIPDQVLIGWFTKDKGIRFTDYLNRDKTGQGFIVISDVEVFDTKTNEQTGKRAFLAVNINFVITASEWNELDEFKKF